MNDAFDATVAFEPPLPDPPVRRARLAQWLRALAACMSDPPAELRDRSTGLHNRAGLFAAAGEMLHPRFGGTPVAMLLVEFPDLREACDLYGHEVARKVIVRVVKRLRRVAGLHGIAARTGPVQFTILLPGTTHAGAARRLERILGKPARIEFDAGDSEIVLVPELLLACLERGAADPIHLHREMARELERLREDERRRLDWLASERERHSRPLPVASR